MEEDDVQSADVFLTLPEDNANSEEDSGDEEAGGSIRNLVGSNCYFRTTCINGKDIVGRIATSDDSYGTMSGLDTDCNMSAPHFDSILLVSDSERNDSGFRFRLHC